MGVVVDIPREPFVAGAGTRLPKEDVAATASFKIGRSSSSLGLEQSCKMCNQKMAYYVAG